MTEIANAIIIVAALIGIMFFMIAYSTTKWEKSAEGRNLMLFPVGFILIALSSLSRRADILPSLSEDIMSIAAWLLVFILMVQRGKHVLQAQSRCREHEETHTFESETEARFHVGTTTDDDSSESYPQNIEGEK